MAKRRYPKVALRNANLRVLPATGVITTEQVGNISFVGLFQIGNGRPMGLIVIINVIIVQIVDAVFVSLFRKGVRNICIGQIPVKLT